MSKMITVTFADGRTKKYAKGVSFLDISNNVADEYRTPVVAVKIDNDIKDLQVWAEKDCRLDFLDLYTDPGIKVYQRSLTFVLIVAARELFGDCDVVVEHSLSKGLFCELFNGKEFTAADISRLEDKMRQIIAADLPILRKVLPTHDAVALFATDGQWEKVQLLKQLKRKTVSIYYCGAFYDYFYGTMTPRTGYLTLFELRAYGSGMILRFPEKENPGVIPPFQEQKKLSGIFQEAKRWGNILRCGHVATWNEKVKAGNYTDIIRVAEALQEKKIAQIADFISSHRHQVRVILVAGPSSSGKTTFAQRLNIQLRVNNVWPVPISLDDYFVDRCCTPLDEKGEYDFDAVEAIDLTLFNEHLTQILNGEEVNVPSYNFHTGMREFRGHKIRIRPDQPLIIEGIHGLNERLTAAVPHDHKIKIYISALTQLSIDNHNRIPTTDARLIRRIVRDSQFRSHDALVTLKMWPSVRRGEERNIFPFQEEADVMFNSALIYELAVLKKYAEPLLEKVTSDFPEYSEAKRLLNFLAYFQSIEDDEIPSNSILREFVGNSCFYK
ncbi:MAG TPA: nucleoside kinase [Patescibacteria group bacterium]|nr:nucleoside kinase [Patescibacteria group bacterium]